MSLAHVQLSESSADSDLLIPQGTPLTPKSANQAMSPRQKPRKGSVSAFQPTSAGKPESPKIAMAPCPSMTRIEYRSRLPCGFPEQVWSRILAYALDAQGLLSQGQQESIVRYALDKNSLRKERELLGLKEAARKWHVLEDMDCLAYEMR